MFFLCFSFIWTFTDSLQNLFSQKFASSLFPKWIGLDIIEKNIWVGLVEALHYSHFSMGRMERIFIELTRWIDFSILSVVIRSSAPTDIAAAT